MLVSDGVIFQRPKYSVPELFVKWPCLKTEGVEECIGAAALDRIEFRTLHHLPTKAMPAYRRGYRKDSNVQPSRPNISEQSAQYLTVLVLQEESNRIPISLPGDCDIMINHNRLHDVAQIDSRIRIENYGRVAHNNKWKTEHKNCVAAFAIRLHWMTFRRL